MRKAIRLFVFMVMAVPVSAQQVADTSYRFDNPNPAYESGAGPQVCIDEAHFNFHTAEGRYKAFAELLRGDGYKVKGFASAFSQKTLSECQILVIANALSKANSHGMEREWALTDWSFPHPSAFTREEINALVTWIREGGSLFFIVDHAPWPGAATDLATLLGVHMLDGSTRSSADAPGDVVFGAVHEELWQQAARAYGIPYEQLRPILANAGTLESHPIVKGRTPQEQIDSVVTFTGHAFYPSANVEPILVFGPKAVCQVPLKLNFEDASWEDGPQFSVGGWLQGAALRLGEGRVVILGEAAMCTAQVEGPNRTPMGMNTPVALQNAQFCLNVVRWLSGLLGE
ncbi:MAG: hypothetical protein ACE5H2_06540 [Terriglobia bacterium]